MAVDLDETGYVIHGLEGDVRGAWDQVDAGDALFRDGTQLVFHKGDEEALLSWSGARSPGSRTMWRATLDKNRGYGSGIAI